MRKEANEGVGALDRTVMIIQFEVCVCVCVLSPFMQCKESPNIASVPKFMLKYSVEQGAHNSERA